MTQTMSAEPEKLPRIVDPPMSVSTSSNSHLAARVEAPSSRTEAQLRARIADLEERLVEVTRLLEAAELAVDDVRAESNEAIMDADEGRRYAERKLDQIQSTRSWRATAPIRTGMGRARRLLRP